MSTPALPNVRTLRRATHKALALPVSLQVRRAVHALGTGRRLLLFLAILGSLASSGQFSSVSKKTLMAADIRKATVYILPTGHEVFDEALYRAVHENWTLCPIGDPKDLPDRIDLSIAGRLYIGYLDGGMRRSIALIRSGTDKPLHDLGPQDILAYCPMGSARNENTIEECAYRIPLMVSVLQQIISTRLQNDGASISERDLHNLGAQRKGFTFLVERALYRDAEIQSLTDELGNRVRFVDRAEVEDAIEERWPNTALFLPVFGFMMDVTVYDLSTRECIYLDHTMESWESTRLLRQHVERLSGTFDLH